MKSLLHKIPKYYLILLVLLVGFKTPFSFNTFTLLFVVLLGLQICFKFKTSGVLLSVFFLFINLYFLGALFSQYAEYISGGSNLLRVGIPICILNMTIAFLNNQQYDEASEQLNVSKMHTFEYSEESQWYKALILLQQNKTKEALSKLNDLEKLNASFNKAKQQVLIIKFSK